MKPFLPLNSALNLHIPKKRCSRIKTNNSQDMSDGIRQLSTDLKGVTSNHQVERNLIFFLELKLETETV